MKSLEEYIIERLQSHLYIDYNLTESAGLYDGIEDLCKFLSNKIKAHQEREFDITYSNTELSDKSNIFFKNIILRCERSNKYDNDGEYVLNRDIDYDDSTKLFNCVVINLYLTLKHNQTAVYSILLHELTHAWDDYNGFLKKSSPLNKINHYKNILNALDGSGAKKILGQILYYITPSEVNARMAELSGVINDNMNPQEALQEIKKSSIYQNYINIGKWVKAIYDDKIDKKFISELCNEYNSVYNKNYTEYKIRILLYKQYRTAMNKINSNIGKICARYIKTMR